MATLLKIKGYLYAAAGIAMAFLALLLRGKVLKHQRDTARESSERYKAHAHRAITIAKADVEITEQTKSRRTDALNEIKQTGNSELFRDPNSMRRSSRKD